MALGVAAVAGRRGAAATDRAKRWWLDLASDLTQLINSGRSEAQIYTGFERLLSTYADMPAVAASVLGPPWRGASSAQQRAFIAAFQSYLSHKYGRQFRDYKNATIKVPGARDGGQAGRSRQHHRGPTRAGKHRGRLADQRAQRQPKVVNLVIEGVSMLANERAEIGAMLDAQGGSVDGLSAQLRKYG